MIEMIEMIYRFRGSAEPVFLSVLVRERRY